MKTVASRANPAVKAMAKLVSSAQERNRRRVVVLDGAHLVAAALAAKMPVESLMVSQSALGQREIAALVARVPDAVVTCVADAAFDAISTVDSSTGVLAVVPSPEGKAIPADADLVLLVEEVQDPGNVGTLLRSAAAAGARHVALSPGCAFAWSLKTVRAGMGAHFLLNIVEGADLGAYLSAYRGTSIALSGNAPRTIYDVDLRGPVAFCVGNEGAGLSRGLLERASERASIPMPGRMESLNAGVAGSLALFEAIRQRSGKMRR